MSILFGAVADDDTGATDLAGMLAERGMRAVLLIDERYADGLPECDAVIVGAGSRALPPRDAYARTRAGVRLLRRFEPDVIGIKYCSTFDSTEAGNIGPSVDAAMDEMQVDFTIALPALPVNGRTTYMGHHFVHRQLLSDSHMRHHPLTPMTSSNLVEHLQRQTSRRVGLVPWPELRDGSLRREGVAIAVLDCIVEEDLQVIAKAVRGMPLLTGSSALAWLLPPVAPRGDSLRSVRHEGGRGFLIVAGSCSEATLRQNEWIAAQGIGTIVLDPLDLASGREHNDAVETAAQTLGAGGTCLLRTSEKRAPSSIGLGIAAGLAAVVKQIVERGAPEGLILAGGETSGAIARALGFGALRVGRNIEPGVPLCMSIGERAMPVVLKSGNFGGPDFYGKAMEAVRGLHG